jgi:hypothetical protein
MKLLCFNKNNYKKYKKFWEEYIFFLNKFYCSHINYYNNTEELTNQYYIHMQNNDYNEITKLIDNIIHSVNLDIITIFDIKMFESHKDFIIKWEKIKVKNILDFEHNSDKKIEEMFVNLFISCYKNINGNDEEHVMIIYNFFTNYTKFKNDIKNDNYRPIFCLAVRLKDKNIIKTLMEYIDIVSIFKNQFDLSIIDGTKSTKILEVLSLINLYDV